MLKHTYEENILRVLQLCRKPATLHYIKDSMMFNNEGLKKYINDIVSRNLVTICIRLKVNRRGRKPLNIYDGRGTKQIRLTEQGKAYLKVNGVMY